MNLAEIAVSSSTGSATVTGNITAAADTLLICVVAAELNYDPGSLTGPSGWAALEPTVGDMSVGNNIIGAWWKANATAGSVNASVTWVKDTFAPVDTPNEMIMHLLEVGGGSLVDDYAGRGGNTDNDGGIPSNAEDGAIAISREGNLGVFTGLIADVAANLSAPTGYSVAAETNSTSTAWCLATYTKALPFATYYEAQAVTSTGRDVDYAFWHLEADIDLAQSIFLGGDF
jgi:hypothetical protein